MTDETAAMGKRSRSGRLPFHPLALTLILIPVLYALTLARGLVLGDPTEYTFVAATLGIAHPPGYAFITLLGKLFQTLIPFGDIALRMHLLSAAAATLAAIFVFGTVGAVGRALSVPYRTAAAVFAALTVALGTDFWQHSIHANPHIITATFLAANLFFLTKWWAVQGAGGMGHGAWGKKTRGHGDAGTPGHGDAETRGRGDTGMARSGNAAADEQGEMKAEQLDQSSNSPALPLTKPTPVGPSPTLQADSRRPFTRSPSRLPSAHHSPNGWLYAFCVSSGLGVTHHPLTIFGFLAYGLFILWVRPGIWREWRLLIKMVAFALLGLSVWLYFPIRSAMQPAFGPGNMNTLDGFLNHVLARGISESLPFFGLADQFDRALVFWSLLRLQYTLPITFLALVGLVWLLWDKGTRRHGDAGTQGRGDAGTRRRGEAGMASRGDAGSDEQGEMKVEQLDQSSDSPAHQADSRRPFTRSPSRLPSALHPFIRSTRPLGLLYGLGLISYYMFVINLRQQDVMAYLLGVFLLIGLLSGIGVLALFDILERRVRLEKTSRRTPSGCPLHARAGSSGAPKPADNLPDRL